jgi:hypothetical protein
MGDHLTLIMMTPLSKLGELLMKMMVRIDFIIFKLAFLLHYGRALPSVHCPERLAMKIPVTKSGVNFSVRTSAQISATWPLRLFGWPCGRCLR